MLTLSTMWGVGRFSDLNDFFMTGEALDFAQFELNHQVNSKMLNDVTLNGYRIVSLHEPCPADVSTATLKARNWLISSPDEEARRQGVAAVQRSMALAHELGAQQIVVHPGRVDMDAALENTLRELYEAGRSHSPEYTAAKEQFMAARATRAEANLEAVRRSLAELTRAARRLGIRLALENRDHAYDIPLPDELACLLETGDPAVLGYCHDVGHAQKLENLGFYAHKEWLRRFASRIIEVHLHDIDGLRDHLAPGLGHMDWDMVARYLPEGIVRTFECRSFTAPAELAAGVRLLMEKGCVLAD